MILESISADHHQGIDIILKNTKKEEHIIKIQRISYNAVEVAWMLSSYFA